MLIVSGGAWYAFVYFGLGKAIVPPWEEPPLNPIDTVAIADIIKEEIKDESKHEDKHEEKSEEKHEIKDTSHVLLDLPEAPVVPDFEDFPIDTTQAINAPQVEDDFDVLAHLQLMRQNASKYNYTMAYKHGARIVSSLLAKPEYIAEWGQILLDAGKPHEAVNVLQRITDEVVVKSDVAINMAFAMLYSKNADGAIEFLDKQMSGNKDIDLVAAKAAIVSEHPEIKKRAEAERIFSKYTSNGKVVSPRADYWYGRFLMQRGDFQKSKIYLERAVKAKPDEPRYIARLGMAEFHLKQDSKAEALYKQALKINPYDYNTWFNLGELYLSLANESSDTSNVRRKIKQALESYLMTIENDSLHINANYRIGLILNGNGQHKEAIPHLNIALEKTEEKIPVMQQLSAAYMSLGDTTKSVAYLENILQIDPFNRIAASEFNRIRGRK